MRKYTCCWLFLIFAIVLLSCGGAPDPSDTAADPGAKLRVGTFNLLRLGHGDSKNLDRVVSLIRRADYDVFAATEVMTEDGAKELLAQLREVDGASWQMTLSPYATGESSYKEFLAFYYDDRRLRPKARGRALCQDELMVDAEGHLCYLRDMGRSRPQYERDPFVAEFQVGDKSYAFFAVHVIYGEQSSEGLQRRQDEVANLLDAMDELRDRHPKTELIALGDFNLAVSKDATESNGKYLAQYVGGNATWRVSIDEPTTVGRSNYDHVIVASNKGLEEERVIADFDFESSEEKSLYKEEVSDHLPVVVELAH